MASTSGAIALGHSTTNAASATGQSNVASNAIVSKIDAESSNPIIFFDISIGPEKVVRDTLASSTKLSYATSLPLRIVTFYL